MKRGRSEPMRGGNEHDAFTGWRRHLCVFYNNTSLVKYWQRKYSKRVRRKIKQALLAGEEM